jgi:hypothetical protein
MSIVGVNDNEGLFLRDILSLVSNHCNLKNAQQQDQNDEENAGADDKLLSSIPPSIPQSSPSLEYSAKTNGKYISITVHAPVESSEQLYSLYERIGRDERVKFKF